MVKNKTIDKLVSFQQKNNSLVCVGLDPDLAKFPQHILKKADPIFEFNRQIINHTHDLVCAYKPNVAFYEAESIKGLKSLKKTVRFLQKNYPQIPIILDAKRGDVANTNSAYVQSIFEDLKVDGVTVQPYLGKQALEPFLKYKHKLIIVLVKTSNPGAGEFQDLKINGQELYLKVAKKVNSWGSNCGLVVGATYTQELKKIRKITDKWLLIPGIGKQGGNLKKTVKYAQKNYFINSSRSIIYAGQGDDFAQKSRSAAEDLKNKINREKYD